MELQSENQGIRYSRSCMCISRSFHSLFPPTFLFLRFFPLIFPCCSRSPVARVYPSGITGLAATAWQALKWDPSSLWFSRVRRFFADAFFSWHSLKEAFPRLSLFLSVLLQCCMCYVFHKSSVVGAFPHEAFAPLCVLVHKKLLVWNLLAQNT
jgi:hypothetical protein